MYFYFYPYKWIEQKPKCHYILAPFPKKKDNREGGEKGKRIGRKPKCFYYNAWKVIFFLFFFLLREEREEGKVEIRKKFDQKEKKKQKRKKASIRIALRGLLGKKKKQIF